MSSSQQDVQYWKNRTQDDPQVDWPYSPNWILGYWESVEHPHRKKIIEKLRKIPEWKSLIEMGCSVGPNLRLINDEFHGKVLYGVEPSAAAVRFAKDNLHGVYIQEGDLLSTSHEPCDVVLADAMMMYIQPEQINEAMDKLCSLAKKAVIIVDRCAETDESNGHIWARNYSKLLTERGFDVSSEKLTVEDWPISKGWQDKGYILVGTK